MKSKIFRTHYRNYVIAYNPKPGDAAISPDYDFFREDRIDSENSIIWSCQTVEGCKGIIDTFEDERLGVLQIEMTNGTVEEIPVKNFKTVANARRWAKAFILNQDMIETRLYVLDDNDVEQCEIYRKEL